MLDLVMEEQAVARKRQQATIQEQARQWDRMFWINWLVKILPNPALPVPYLLRKNFVGLVF